MREAALKVADSLAGNVVCQSGACVMLCPGHVAAKAPSVMLIKFW